MGKIAVLGSTGHLGKHAIEYLLEFGVSPSDIIAIYRKEEKALPLKDKGIEIRYGDYSSTETFKPEVFAGAEKLLFVSSSTWTEFERIQEHLIVLDCARKAGIKHIVYTSMANPFKSTFTHEQTHVATEYAIRATKIPYTILRNTFYLEYFLVQKDLKRCVDSGIFYSLSQGKKINLVTRKNLARAAAVILTTEGDAHLNKTYELTAPKAYTYKDICEDLAEITGKKIEFVETNEKDYLAYLTKLGIPEKFQKWDTGYAQLGYAGGWAENAYPDLANIIGEENVTTPKQYMQAMDFN